MLPLGFNPFGNDVESHALPQRNDGPCNGGAIGVYQHVTHKRLVNFQLVQRKRAVIPS